MHPQVSLLKYTWAVRGGHIFNNAYYKNIVRDTDWFIESEVIIGFCNNQQHYS